MSCARSPRRSRRRASPTGRRSATPSATRPTWSYPLLWSFGGAETDNSGKKVAINSKGALEAVKFMTALWKEGCDEGGLAWDDTNNNRAFLAGEICATLNGASIYIVAKRQKDKIKDERGEPMCLTSTMPVCPRAGGAWSYPLHFSNGTGS